MASESWIYTRNRERVRSINDFLPLVRQASLEILRCKSKRTISSKLEAFKSPNYVLKNPSGRRWKKASVKGISLSPELWDTPLPFQRFALAILGRRFFTLRDALESLKFSRNVLKRGEASRKYTTIWIVRSSRQIGFYIGLPLCSPENYENYPCEASVSRHHTVHCRTASVKPSIGSRLGINSCAK